MLHLLDFFHFLRHPDNRRLELAGGRALGSTLLFFLFLLPLTIFLSFPANFWQEPEIYLVDMVSESLSDTTLYVVFFMVILGPVWEELIFRYALRLSLRRIFTAGLFLLAFLTMDLWSLLDPKAAGLEFLAAQGDLLYFSEMSLQMIWAGALSLLIPLMLPGLSWDREMTAPSRFQWGLWIHTAAFVFAQMHLFNYEILRPEGWILAFLLNLPRWFLGLGLSYVRIRLGLVWAVVLHITNNAFFVLIYRLSGPV